MESTARALKRAALKLASNEQQHLLELHGFMRDQQEKLKDLEAAVLLSQRRKKRLEDFDPILKGELACPKCWGTWELRSPLRKNEFNVFKCTRCDFVSVEHS